MYGIKEYPITITEKQIRQKQIALISTRVYRLWLDYRQLIVTFR